MFDRFVGSEEERREYEMNREKQWRRFGIKDFTFSSFRKLYNQQNGKCADCGKNLYLYGVHGNFNVPKDMIAEVDHSHITGFVRDVLCHSCNMKRRSGDLKRYDGTEDKMWSNYNQPYLLKYYQTHKEQICEQKRQYRLRKKLECDISVKFR
jgi:hypothetical protein